MAKTYQIIATVLCIVGLLASPALAQDETELAKKLQNPVAALISVPLQNNFEWGAGLKSRSFQYTLNFQPVIPISIGEDWNLISRTIVPIKYQSDVIGATSQGGLGDIVQSAFLSPKEPGPGAEKFGLGPTAVVLRQQSGWTYGLLANHIVSIGGTRSTSDVNATFLQPFLSYTTATQTTFGINTEATYDWENSKWTVPLNPSVSQLLKIGKQPISLAVGPKIYIEGPTGAPDWGIRFAVTFLFPK